MYIIKSSGRTSIDTFVTDNGYTTIPSEAKKFDSIEAAKAFWGKGKQAQVLDADTLKWAAWINY